MIGFLFLIAYSADKVYKGDVLLLKIGDLQFVDELNSVGAFYMASYSLGMMTNFVGHREVPCIFELGVA